MFSSILRIVAVAALIFAGGWWLACQADGPAAPTAPPAPANRTGAAEAAGAPDSTDVLSGDEALAIWAYEARSTFEARFGPEWTTLARNALGVNLVAGGATEEQAESFRRLVRLVLDADLAAAGSPAAAEGDAASDLRRELRAARLPFGGEVAYSTAPVPRSGPPSGFDGSDDTCNHYDACVGRNRSRCQRYAQDEMAFVILASDQGCIWVGVLSGTATSNPLIGLGAGALCQFISSGLRRYMESAFEENCLVIACGTYPYCI